jgi:hypothetical protein
MAGLLPDLPAACDTNPRVTADDRPIVEVVVKIATQHRRAASPSCMFRVVPMSRVVFAEIPTSSSSSSSSSSMTLRERRLLHVHEESRALHLALALNTNEINRLITNSCAHARTIIEPRVTMYSRALININRSTSRTNQT